MLYDLIQLVKNYLKSLIFQQSVTTKQWTDNNWQIISFTVWAETGDFRESSHSSMTAVASSIDHTQLNFQTTSRNRNRDRKNDGK